MVLNRKILWFMISLVAICMILLQCSSRLQADYDPRGPGYAGAQTCRSCHKTIYDSYIHTAHFNTTQEAGDNNIAGNFQPPHNRFQYNDSTWIDLQKRDSGYYQAAFVNGKETEAHRIDILFGIRHAQTFLSWKKDRTIELPVSYYKAINGWATSPGFSSTRVYFSRFINAGCYECHSSFIGSKLNPGPRGMEEVLHRNTMIFGIDCEKCHGPAATHVQYHTNNPGSAIAKYITAISNLPRERKLDACAVCHSGNNKIQVQSTFRFKPGDTLSNYFTTWSGTGANARFDVHGNQFQLLAQSACFRKTNTLDCSTCHNPHADASGNLTAYSASCSNCHGKVQHSFVKDELEEKRLAANCIDCHMPKQSSQAITYKLPGDAEKSAYQLRTHLIGIYLDSVFTAGK
jgi:hypothetical protein